MTIDFWELGKILIMNPFTRLNSKASWQEDTHRLLQSSSTVGRVFILRETLVVLYVKQTDQIRMATGADNFEMIGNSETTLFDEFDGDVVLFEGTVDGDAAIGSSSNRTSPIQLNFTHFTAHFYRTLKSGGQLSTDLKTPPFLSPPIRWVASNAPFIQSSTATEATIDVYSLASLALFQNLFMCCNEALYYYEQNANNLATNTGLTALNQFVTCDRHLATHLPRR